MRIHPSWAIGALLFGALGWGACSTDDPGEPPDAAGGGSSEITGGGDGDAGDEAEGPPRGGAPAVAGNGSSGGRDTDDTGEAGSETGDGGQTPGADGGRSQGGSPPGGAEEPETTPGRSCAPESLYEPNDSAGNPCWIEPNMAIASALVADDVDDYYSIDLEKGVTYTLDLFAPANLQRGLTLTVGGKVAALVERATEYADVSHLEFTAPASGRAVFHLNGTGQYEFVIWDERVERDVNFEPNNSASLAAPIDVDQHIDQALTSAKDDYDHYRFDVVAGVTYTLDLWLGANMKRKATQVVAGQPFTYLPDETIYADSTHEEIKARATGSVLLTLQGAGAYQFTLVEENPAHDAISHEPNNSPSTAALLALGTTVTSDLGSKLGDNVDYFTVPVKASKGYVLHLERTANLSLQVTLAKSSHEVFGKTTIYGTIDEPLTTLAEDDHFLVRLEGAGNYELSVAAQ